MADSFWLDVMTPSKKFFSGEVEEVIITTPVGKEGFMAKHSWTCKLLDAGELWIRELGAASGDWKIASAAGGFVDVKKDMVIYTDAIEWNKGEGGRKSRTISSEQSQASNSKSRGDGSKSRDVNSVK